MTFHPYLKVEFISSNVMFNLQPLVHSWGILVLSGIKKKVLPVFWDDNIEFQIPNLRLLPFFNTVRIWQWPFTPR